MPETSDTKAEKLNYGSPPEQIRPKQYKLKIYKNVITVNIDMTE